MSNIDAIETRLAEIKDELMVVDGAVEETKETILSNQYEYTELVQRQSKLRLEQRQLCDRII